MRPLRRWCAGCVPDLVRRLREQEEEDRYLLAQVCALQAQIQRALEAGGGRLPIREGVADADLGADRGGTG